MYKKGDIIFVTSDHREDKWLWHFGVVVCNYDNTVKARWFDSTADSVVGVSNIRLANAFEIARLRKLGYV